MFLMRMRGEARVTENGSVGTCTRVGSIYDHDGSQTVSSADVCLGKDSW